MAHLICPEFFFIYWVCYEIYTTPHGSWELRLLLLEADVHTSTWLWGPQRCPACPLLYGVQASAKFVKHGLRQD